MSKFDNIRTGLTFDDVLLVPLKSEVLPSDVSLKTNLTKDIELKHSQSATPVAFCSFSVAVNLPFKITLFIVNLLSVF